MIFFRLIFFKELSLIFRRSHDWIYPLIFFLIVIVFFPLAFSPDPLFLQKIFSGCIWIAILFANLLSIQTIFTADCEDGYLEQCFLSQQSFPTFLFAKISAHWCATQLPFILLTPLLAVLFQFPLSIALLLSISLLLGTPVLMMLSIFGVALTLSLRQQGVLLSLMVLPLATPILIFGVNIVQQFAVGFDVSGALAFLGALTILSLVFFPFVIASVIKIGMDD